MVNTSIRSGENEEVDNKSAGSVPPVCDLCSLDVDSAADGFLAKADPNQSRRSSIMVISDCSE